MDEKKKKYEFFLIILALFFIYLSVLLLQTKYFGNLILSVIIVIILFLGWVLIAKFVHNQISEYPWLPRTEEEKDEPANHNCEVNLTYIETFDRCIQSLQMFKDIKIELSDRQNGVITAIVPDRPFYNPEMDLRQSVITLTIKRKTSTLTDVNILSKRAPYSPTPYGMNKVIVEKICMFLQDPALMIDTDKENVSSY